jgi:antitoxin YefM
MFVEAQLSEDAVEAGGGGFGHSGIVNAPWGGRVPCTIRTKVFALIEITCTNLRQRLTATLDQVANEREVVVVRRRGKESVAMIPAGELAGLMETAHLLRSPKNARRLLTALSRVPAARSRSRNSSLDRR